MQPRLPLRRFVALALLVAVTASQQGRALDELFDLYSAPQALALGNAYTAAVSGHPSLFYNPAGLARGSRRRWEFKPVAFDFIGSTGGLGTTASARTFGMYRLYPSVNANPGRYHFIRATAVPAFSWKNFGFALLGRYQFAARADSSGMIDTDSGMDAGIVAGGAINLAGNLVKIGISTKALIRNQLKGQFAASTLADEESIKSQMKEGVGFGADIGMLFTLPQKYLPTIGLVWKDALGTRFNASHILNGRASGTPDAIAQTFHAGFSITPNISPRLKTMFSAEFRHIDRSDLPITKRIHVGMQIETERAFYIWLGANQLLPTFGMGLRVYGGDIEIGTYAQDIEAGSTRGADRRFTFRYTVGF